MQIYYDFYTLLMLSFDWLIIARVDQGNMQTTDTKAQQMSS